VLGLAARVRRRARAGGLPLPVAGRTDAAANGWSTAVAGGAELVRGRVVEGRDWGEMAAIFGGWGRMEGSA